jgi:hypothetical protein
VQQPTCVLVSMKGKEPASLPKGLPAPPEGSSILLTKIQPFLVTTLLA